MKRIYLSRRNLEVLLSKLNRAAAGEQTACAIIKYRNPADPPEYTQSLDQVQIVAVEDTRYYASRAAGEMHPADTPKTTS